MRYKILFLIFGYVQFSWTQIHNILDYGAKPESDFINTSAINEAINVCHSQGGGTVFIPKGEFVTGTLHLKSNINLYLEKGAKLIGSSDIKDYDVMPEGYYYSGKNYMGIFFANDVINVSLSGKGTVDGRGTSFMKQNTRYAPSISEREFTRQKEEFRDTILLEDGPLKFIERPGHILTISNAENVSIKNILFADSPKWTLRIGGSKNVNISDIKIENNILIPNSDGIHITSSSNVTVTNSNVIAGDDALIVTGFISGYGKTKYGNQSSEAKNIIFSNCNITSKSSGIRVGYGEKPISNIIFKNINIMDSNRGIGVFSRDKSSINKIIFSNISIQSRLHSDGWWGKSEPIHISAIQSTKNGIAGKISNIIFENIKANSESGIIIYSENDSKISNINIKRLKIKIEEGRYSKKYGGNFDLRPTSLKGKSLFEHDIPALYVKGVEDLKIDNVIVKWGKQNNTFYTHGLEMENFENITISNFNISAASKNKADIKLTNGEKFKFLNDRSPNQRTKIIYPKTQ